MVVGPQEIGFAQGTGLDFGERLLLLLFQQADDHPVAAVHPSPVICTVAGVEGIDQTPFIPGGGHGGQGGDIAGFAEYEVIHASLFPVHVPAQQAFLGQAVITGGNRIDGLLVGLEELVLGYASMAFDIQEPLAGGEKQRTRQ